MYYYYYNRHHSLHFEKVMSESSSSSSSPQTQAVIGDEQAVKIASEASQIMELFDLCEKDTKRIQDIINTINLFNEEGIQRAIQIRTILRNSDYSPEELLSASEECKAWLNEWIPLCDRFKEVASCIQYRLYIYTPIWDIYNRSKDGVYASADDFKNTSKWDTYQIQQVTQSLPEFRVMTEVLYKRFFHDLYHVDFESNYNKIKNDIEHVKYYKKHWMIYKRD